MDGKWQCLSGYGNDYDGQCLRVKISDGLTIDILCHFLYRVMHEDAVPESCDLTATWLM